MTYVRNEAKRKQRKGRRPRRYQILGALSSEKDPVLVLTHATAKLYISVRIRKMYAKNNIIFFVDLFNSFHDILLRLRLDSCACKCRARLPRSGRSPESGSGSMGHPTSFPGKRETLGTRLWGIMSQLRGFPEQRALLWYDCIVWSIAKLRLFAWKVKLFL